MWQVEALDAAPCAVDQPASVNADKDNGVCVRTVCNDIAPWGYLIGLLLVLLDG